MSTKNQKIAAKNCEENYETLIRSCHHRKQFRSRSKKIQTLFDFLGLLSLEIPVKQLKEFWQFLESVFAFLEGVAMIDTFAKSQVATMLSFWFLIFLPLSSRFRLHNFDPLLTKPFVCVLLLVYIIGGINELIYPAKTYCPLYSLKLPSSFILNLC